jgi:hypothetical protein
MAAYCDILITNCGLIAKPVSETLIRMDIEPFIWTMECQTAFKAVFVTLHSYDKILDTNNLMGETFILAHTFRGFSP